MGGEGGCGGGAAGGLPAVADAAPAATATAWTDADAVATAAAATAATLRTLAAVVPPLFPMAVRAVATVVVRLPEKRGVVLTCVAVVATVASGLAFGDAAVGRGAAASAAAVQSSGLDTALGVVAAWEVDGEVMASTMGRRRDRGRAKRASSALKRCPATARLALTPVLGGALRVPHDLSRMY